GVKRFRLALDNEFTCPDRCRAVAGADRCDRFPLHVLWSGCLRLGGGNFLVLGCCFHADGGENARESPCRIPHRRAARHPDGERLQSAWSLEIETWRGGAKEMEKCLAARQTFP